MIRLVVVMAMAAFAYVAQPQNSYAQSNQQQIDQKKAEHAKLAEDLQRQRDALVACHSNKCKDDLGEKMKETREKQKKLFKEVQSLQKK